MNINATLSRSGAVTREMLYLSVIIVYSSTLGVFRERIDQTLAVECLPFPRLSELDGRRRRLSNYSFNDPRAFFIGDQLIRVFVVDKHSPRLNTVITSALLEMSFAGFEVLFVKNKRGRCRIISPFRGWVFRDKPPSFPSKYFRSFRRIFLCVS